MTFPETAEEFMEQYKIVDTEEVYTNGMELVPIFRMKQWFDHVVNGITLEDLKTYYLEPRFMTPVPNEYLAALLAHLEHTKSQMTVEEYRQRMMDAFHNADCDQFIALVVLPAEKEFQHLEWLLRNVWARREDASLGEYSKIVVETDEENPVHIATVTAGETDVAAGYRVRITPRYD